MKKFDLKGVKGVFSGLRGSEKSQTKQELEVAETLEPQDFYCAKVARHGFPYHPTALGWDPVQKLLAVGTKTGHIKIMGKPGVDYHIQHEREQAVLQVLFLINEGALISSCADNSIHLWNYRQKVPEIVNTLKFSRDKVSRMHLPYQTKWLYVGTERGNVHLVNIESFTLSGYTINWNKCIEMSQKTHPGSVVHLSECPSDSNKLLIGFSTGLIVLWDLKTKMAETRYHCAEPLRDIEWNHEGRQFMCAHTDGSLTTWNCKTPAKPVNHTIPHQRSTGEDCKPITRLQWKSMKNGEPYVIFTGGLSSARTGKSPSLTLTHGKSTTVLELEHRVVDFLVMCNCVWPHEYSDPYAIVVLMSSDLLLIDLTTPGYPIFENPYPMNIHESPLSHMVYYSDCASDLIPAFYSCGMKQKRKEYSAKPFPIGGGVWGSCSCSYSELLITGHADGSLKFWDSSGVALQYLYKVKTSRLFERPQSGDAEEKLSIRHIFLEEESRLLVAGAAHHVVLFDFTKKEMQAEVPRLDIAVVSEVFEEHGCFTTEADVVSASRKARGSNPSTGSDRPTESSNSSYLSPRKGPRLWPAGYQPVLVCELMFLDSELCPTITAVALNSSYGLMAVGTTNSLFVVDIIQKSCIMNVAVAELYGSGEAMKMLKSPLVVRTSFEDGPSTPADPKSPLPQDQSSQAASSSSQESSSTTQLAGQSTQLAGQSTPPVSQSGPTSAQQLGLQPSDLQSVPLRPPRRTKQNRLASTQNKDVKFHLQDDSNADQDSLGVLCDQAQGDRLSKSGPVALPSVTVESIVNIPHHKVQSVHQPLSKACSAPPPTRSNSSPSVDLIASKEASPRAPPPPRRATAGVVNMSEIKSENQLRPSSQSFNSGQGSGMLSKMRRLSTRLGLTKKMNGFNFTPSTPGLIKQKFRWRSQGTRKPPSGGGSVPPLHDPPAAVVPPDGEITLDKTDGAGVSQSSSLSSIEQAGLESVQSLGFADGYTKKTDHDTTPGLWVGTNMGNVVVIVLNIPAAGEMRMKSSVILNPSGTVFRAKGSVMDVSFLNYRGLLIPSEAEIWTDKEKELANKNSSCSKDGPKEKRLLSRLSRSQMMTCGPDGAAGGAADQQMVCIGTDLQVYVMAMPSQSILHRVKFPEDRPAISMSPVVVKESVCLVCLFGSGHVTVYSLPSLRPLLELANIGSCDPYAARTWCASNHAHALFMCSPMEMCKLTLSRNMCRQVNDMMGDLFSPKENPECPKPSFFKNLFAPLPAVIDREELFGEESGRASSSIAQKIPGSSLLQAHQSASSATSEVSRARQALDERGEKLSHLDDKTAQLRSNAEEFANTAHKLANQYSQKKWYHF